MKIVNRSDFLKLPDGIVYSDYRSHGMISGLYIKHDTWAVDWIYRDLIDSVECNGCGERVDIFIEAERNGGTFKMDLQCYDRDGRFETEQYFVIYDKSDVENLIEKLLPIAKHYPDNQ